MAKRGICTNIGNCENANNKTVLTIQDGQDFVCPNPECGKELRLVKSDNGGGLGLPKPIIYVLGLLLLAGLGWGAFEMFGGGGKKASAEQNSATVSDTSEIATLRAISDTSVNSTANYFLTDFTYTPTLPDPKNSELRGVVELGATGFNSFVVRIDGQRNWKLEKAEFGSSLVYEHMATEEDIRKGLIEYIAQILKDGVKPQNIHFIASSGASSEDNVIKIMDGLRKYKGYVVNTVTPEQEAKFALRSVLPKGYENSAFVVDMGSSNTKVAYINNGMEKGFDTYGSKYFQLNYTDEEVRADIQRKLEQVPQTSRKLCFIIGGVPFELAKQERKDKERYNCLKSPNSYAPKGDRQKAGLNIISGIAKTTQCRQFVFDWDANFSIGFLLSL